MKQNKVMFFNFDYMGIGGLWQNISWLLTNQKEPLEINLHLNDENFNKWIEIYNCFNIPKAPIEIKQKETIHLKQDYSISWKDNLKNLKIPNYTEEQIQTVPCTLRHEYYPTKFNLGKNRFSGMQNHICYYLNGPDQIYNGHKYTLPRNINDKDAQKIVDKLKNPIKLGLPMSIKENVLYISTAKYCIGREGGWTHVAHSCRTDYYPVMYQHHPALDYSHGKENKYLKKFQTVKEYYESL